MDNGFGISYLLRRINRGPRPDRAEEQAHVARASNGDRGATEVLVSSNLAYVVSIAKEFRGSGLPIEDVVAEGCIGLLKAIRRYRAASGTRFMTYATFWVRKEILAAVSDQTQMIHVPRYARERGRSSPRLLRLDVPKRNTGNLSLAESLRHPDPLPAETVIQSGQARDLRRHVLRLPPRDRAVIAWRYGLGGQPEQTLGEIGGRLGLSKERVRQIEVEALGSLRLGLGRRVGEARSR